MRAKDEENPRERARAIALRALAHRPRSEAEIRARLARADLAAEADQTVAWLSRLGYLDDAAFARARARGLVERAGPKLAERRLRSAGIAEGPARAAVREAMEEVAPPGSGAELALCRALALRRSKGAAIAGLDDRTRARLARWLLGRGFSGWVVAQVVGTFGDVEVE